MNNVDNLAFLLETAFLVAYDTYDDIAMPKLRQLDWVRGEGVPSRGWEGKVAHANTQGTVDVSTATGLCRSVRSIAVWDARRNRVVSSPPHS